MKTRKRHENTEQHDLAVTCDCCATNSAPGRIVTYHEQGTDREVSLCEECEQNHEAETGERYNDDTLNPEQFEKLSAWAKREAILLFTNDGDKPLTVADVEEFCDTLTAFLNWHPDNSFKDYVDGEGKAIFTPAEAIELDGVLHECFTIAKRGGTDIYDLAVASFQRAGLAPIEAVKEPETAACARLRPTPTRMRRRAPLAAELERNRPKLKRKSTIMERFTVILMYPDYFSEDYGETWCEPVTARNPVEAVEVAQRTCAAQSPSINNPDDLLPVSVFEGDHRDLVGVWAAAMATRS